VASDQATIDYLLEQMAGAGDVRARKMFGEYAVYCRDKVVAFVCDNRLYLKPTQVGHELVREVILEPPYPTAKLYLVVREEDWDDRDYLAQLISKTAEAVPAPKKRR
jgi:DNA transformation protein